MLTTLAILTAIAIQSDGKIVVGGGTGANCVPPNCLQEYKFALARYDTNGSLDTTFGSSGTQLGNVAKAYIKDIAIQPDDKIVAAGPMTSKLAFIMARFDVNGTFDSTFVDSNSDAFEPTVAGEIIMFPYQDIFHWSEAYSVAIQPSDGKIVVGGYSCGGYNGVNPEFAIIRLWP